MNFATFKKWMIAELALLVFQFHAGMITNLFITIPDTNPLAILLAPSDVEFLLHVINGFVILAIGCPFLLQSVRLRHQGMLYASLLGLASTGMAITFGFVFFLAGHDNAYSIAMAISFISAFTIFFIELYILGRIEKT